MSNEKQGHQGRGSIIAFLITLFRGIVAIALGVILIFDPTRSQVLLMNLMGFFWLTSWLVLIRRPGNGGVAYSKRTSLIIGIVGIVTGLLVVSHNIARQWVPEIAVIELLGAVILLTGVRHVMGEFRFGGVFKRRHETLNFLLGLFEIVLGLGLILSPLEHGPITYWTATIWALVFGALVIGDALTQWVRKPEEIEAPTQQDRPKSVPETNGG